MTIIPHSNLRASFTRKYSTSLISCTIYSLLTNNRWQQIAKYLTIIKINCGSNSYNLPVTLLQRLFYVRNCLFTRHISRHSKKNERAKMK